MHQKRLLPFLLATFPTALLSHGCSAPTREAGLRIEIDSDMDVPKTVSEVGIVVQGEGGTVYYARRWAVEDGQVKLPASLGLSAPKNGERVTVSAIAYRKKLDGTLVPFVIRDARTRVPTTRAARLPLALDWLSWGSSLPGGPVSSSTSSGFDLPKAELDALRATKCPTGETSVAGVCVSADVEESALPEDEEAPASTACFDPRRCFEHEPPALLAFQPLDPDVSKPCVATLLNDQQKLGDLGKFNIGIRSRNGFDWTWLPLDFDPNTNPITALDRGRSWRVEGESILLPRSACEAIAADRKALGDFANSETGTIPERGAVGAYLAKGCDSVKTASVPVCAVRSDRRERNGADPGPGPLDSDAGAPSLSAEREEAETVRRPSAAPMVGCGAVEDVSTAPANLAGLVVVANWPFAILDDGSIRAPELGLTEGVPVESLVAGDTFLAGKVGAEVTTWEATLPPGSAVPTFQKTTGSDGLPLVLPFASSLKDFRVGTPTATEPGMLVGSRAKEGWPLPIGTAASTLGALGPSRAFPAFVGTQSDLTDTTLKTYHSVSGRFLGVAMGLDQAILQDGDRLLQAPIAGETIQPEHLLPHRAVAPKKGTGFGFVGNELVVALPEYGILVRTDRDAKEAQLCVPYWGRSLGAPMPTIGGFSVGIGRNANDLQTNRTYAYWAERPADSTGEYAVRRVELVR